VNTFSPSLFLSLAKVKQLLRIDFISVPDVDGAAVIPRGERRSDSLKRKSMTNITRKWTSLVPPDRLPLGAFVVVAGEVRWAKQNHGG